ncbi:condensation domain-containing protein [Frankia sp. AgKG'84/4]
MLTPGEQILAASDRASAPLTCGLFLQTDGRLDPSRLRAAAWAVIRRHPMARAVLYGSRQHAWRFSVEPAGDPVGFIDDGTDGWRIQEILSSMPFDLHRYPPLRIALVRRPGGDQICVVAHHLALDGLRLTALVTEIIEDYRRLSRETRPGGDDEPEGARRGMPAGMSSLVRTVGAPGWSTLVRRSGRFITPLAVERGEGFGFHPMSLPLPTGGRTLPDGRRMTVNDLLLAAAHLAVDRWNARRGGISGRLSVRMPMDIGPALAADRSVPPSAFLEPGETNGNHTGQTIIVSDADDRSDAVRLATRIVDQTVAAKQTVPVAVSGLSGALGVAAARFVPGPWRSTLLRVGVSAGRAVLAPTAAVSNIGRYDGLAGPLGAPGGAEGGGRRLVAVGSAGPTAVPGPSITEVYFTGTVGMPQGLFIAVLGQGGELKVTVCYHRQLFGPGSVPAFADLYRAAYEEVAAIGATSSPPAARSTPPAPARRPQRSSSRPASVGVSDAGRHRRGTVPQG